MRYLVDSQQMATLDKQTIQEFGIPGRSLMETAGRAAAEVVMRALSPQPFSPWLETGCKAEAPAPHATLVACGSGNNGGDGYVVARLLAALGWPVQVFVFAERQRLEGDALGAFKTLESCAQASIQFVTEVRGLRDFETACNHSALIVDAMLGVGLKGDVRGLMRDAIGVVNKAQRLVVSIDIASGICADTGRVLAAAVRANHTITFGFAKRGHYLYPGADHRGALHVADISIPPSLIKRNNILTRVLLPEDGPALLPSRQANSHKGTYGHAVVLAGSEASPGAAALCLRAAIRAGAGLVSLACHVSTLKHMYGLIPEVMLRLRETADAAAYATQVVQQATSITIGPGLGTHEDAAAVMAEVIAQSKVPLCLDADALNMLAQRPQWWEQMQAPVVITPHPKEMARLMQSSVEAVQEDRMGAALAFAQEHRCTVVLKGAGTVVADGDGQAVVVAAGNAGLAKGGTGDVLAGIVGAFLAQGIKPFQAAELAVLLHGAAGDAAASELGQTGMSATDVIASLGTVLQQWHR